MSQGFDYGFKPGAGAREDTAGTYTDARTGVEITWTYHSGSTSILDWSANRNPAAVIVKGGPRANIYTYNGLSASDATLMPPANDGGNIAGVSHLEFCYTFRVDVTKTAETSYKRTHAWGIAKTSDVASVDLLVGESKNINYTVTVTRDVGTDSDMVVAGDITLTNPWPTAALITSVTDSLGVPVNCPATTVPAGGSVTCTYSAPVADKDRVCGSDTFQYSQQVGPYAAAGTYTVHNTAAYLTDDTGSTGDDDNNVDVTVTDPPPAVAGCRLTQGYWKTHSQAGPASYDAGWSKLVGGQEHNTAFYASRQTWLQVFNTPPRGNAYYQLAHQFMAAELNVLNGASASADVVSAIAEAKALFAGSSGTTFSEDQRARAGKLASQFDAFNNGNLGTPHCS